MKKIFLNHWLAIILICCGTFLRVYDLNNRAILFGDSARDILVAIDAVENNELPLLGIPSSRPQFKQGPVSIWMIMSAQALFGTNIYVFALIFSFMGILALIAIYEFCLVFFNKKTAEIALFLLAFSPLAIANSRMIYHVTPIPFMMVISIYFLICMWKKRQWGWFFSALSLSLLFQFELSLAPFFLIIPYILWQSKQKLSRKVLFQLLAGISLGLLPQIIYDFSNNFQQLGRFGAWVVFRFTTFFIPGERSFSFEKASIFFENYWHYFGRIISVDNNFTTLIFVILIFTSSLIIWKNLQKKNYSFNSNKIIAIKIISVLTALLTLGYFINGSPSEAYFPPYFILLPLIIGFSFGNLIKFNHFYVLTVLTLWSGINILQIFNANFFVSTNSNFNYGPSVMEQRAIVSHIIYDSNDNYYFATNSEAGKFATFLDNYRLLALEKKSSENSAGNIYFIENQSENSQLHFDDTKSKINKTNFKTMTVYGSN